MIAYLASLVFICKEHRPNITLGHLLGHGMMMMLAGEIHRRRLDRRWFLKQRKSTIEPPAIDHSAFPILFETSRNHVSRPCVS